MTMPRVLHIIKTLNLGGAETNLLNLVRVFDPARVETHVAYSFGGEIEPRFRAAGVRLFKYANDSHKVKSPHSLLIVLRLAAYIRRHRIDIVQTHNFNGHIWGLLAARLTGAKVVEHVHDFRYVAADELRRRHGLIEQYRFIKYFRRQSDRVVVLTRDNADYVVANGLSDAGRVRQIQNGISFDDDVGSPEGLRARFDLPEEAVVVLTSARMDRTKNVDLILRIAPQVLKAHPDVVFLVAGSGTHLAEYRRLAEDLGVASRVRFIGFHQNMYELLAASDVFLLPSFLELHSIAILEAQRMKVPVVVSRGVGCNDEFIDDGVTGFLCDPFAEAPWVSALGRLADDADLRRRIGVAGYETAHDRFDIVRTGKAFEDLYAELAPEATRRMSGEAPCIT